eukprot:NODE_131_length_3122_cov_42.382363_g121_i0.p1 GENE.NODE_131_length_3122_cov_42.382363_g121_i0~~NODE_131_length_3122_cov_42.382363_g121_i0.p1  ORF type:complete len:983 (+),score=192.21 NODE_131_length_3122_cov_42.382363_g121_i0:87-3035(+)
MSDIRLDTTTHRKLEVAFLQSKERLVSAVSVQKHRQRARGGLRKKPAARLLCLTQNDKSLDKTLLRLHSIREKNGAFEITHTYPLRGLKCVRRDGERWALQFPSSVTLVVGDAPRMDVFFAEMKAMVAKTYGKDVDDATEGHGGVETVTNDGEYSDMAESEREDDEEQDFTPQVGADDDSHGDLAAGAWKGAKGEGVMTTLLGAQDEATIEEALARLSFCGSASAAPCSSAAGLLEGVREALEKEQTTLELQCVRFTTDAEQILEPLLTQLQQVSMALAALDSQLADLDVPLQPLREDATAFVQRGTDLEISKAEDAVLVRELANLTERLTLVGQPISVLDHFDFEPNSLSQMDSALETVEVFLKDPTLSGSGPYARMKAVRQRQSLCVDRRADFFNRSVRHLVSRCASLDSSTRSGSGRLASSIHPSGITWAVPNSIESSHRSLESYARLLSELRVHERTGYEAVKRAYTAAIQLQYRREATAHFHTCRTLISSRGSLHIKAKSSLLGSTDRQNTLSMYLQAHGSSMMQHATSSRISGSSGESTPQPSPRFSRGAPSVCSDATGATFIEDGGDSKRPDCLLRDAVAGTLEVLLKECSFMVGKLAVQPEELPSVLRSAVEWPEKESELSIADGSKAQLSGPWQWITSPPTVPGCLLIFLRKLLLKADKIYVFAMFGALDVIRGFFKECTDLVDSVCSAVQVELEATVKLFVGEQSQSIRSCKYDTKETFILPYFARFPLLWQRVCGLVNDSPTAKVAAVEAFRGLADCIFAALETISQEDGKYSNLICFNNYAYFAFRIGSSDSKELSSLVQLAEQRKCRFMEAYLRALCARSLPDLFGYVAGVDELLLSYTAQEVGYQAQFSKTAATRILTTMTKKHLQSAFEDILSRLRKHFFRGVKAAPTQQALLRLPGSMSPALSDPSLTDEDFRQAEFVLVLQQLQNLLSSTFQRFAALLDVCFPGDSGLQLPVPLEAIPRLFLPSG